MPATTGSLPVTGSIRVSDGAPQLVLTERLGGHDTFLSGVLELDRRRIPVRIITLDDVTVLRPLNPADLSGVGGTCVGDLHLPHGARPRTIPADLAAEATRHSRALGVLDDAELRYALTFLEEATTTPIRQARIAAIVAALPRASRPDEQTAPQKGQPDAA